MTKDETLATLKGLTYLARGLIYPRAEAFEVDHQPGLGYRLQLRWRDSVDNRRHTVQTVITDAQADGCLDVSKTAMFSLRWALMESKLRP